MFQGRVPCTCFLWIETLSPRGEIKLTEFMKFRRLTRLLPEVGEAVNNCSEQRRQNNLWQPAPLYAVWGLGGSFPESSLPLGWVLEVQLPESLVLF